VPGAGGAGLADCCGIPGVTMNDERSALFERLRKIQALYDAPGTAGEQAAAAAAAERLRERLREPGSPSTERAPAPASAAEAVIEFRIKVEDAWSRRLFLAIARHHGASPFRYRGQRRSSVMLKATRTVMNRRIMPHYQAAEVVLREHFDAIAAQVIRDSLQVSDEDAVEEPEPPRSLADS